MIGRGILTWNGAERRSNRYGGFFLNGMDYNQTRTCEPFLDDKKLDELNGSRVKVIAHVVESAESGHVGDSYLFLPENPEQHIKPTRPDTGEVLVVGIGNLIVDNKVIYIQPSDGRNKFWIDPRTLYRLHDQLVEISIEPTDESDLPITDLLDNTNENVLRKIDEDKDGVVFQIKGENPSNLRFPSRFRKIGDGLFEMTNPTRDCPIGTDFSKSNGEMLE